MLASDVMTREVTTVAPSMHLEELVELLTLKGVSGAPVVNDQGTLVGVVSLSDVAQSSVHRAPHGHYADFAHDLWCAELVDELEPVDLRLQVEDIMNENSIDVEADAPLAEVVALILQLRVHRVIVVDKHRQVVGLISTIDLVRLLPDLLAQRV